MLTEVERRSKYGVELPSSASLPISIAAAPMGRGPGGRADEPRRGGWRRFIGLEVRVSAGISSGVSAAARNVQARLDRALHLTQDLEELLVAVPGHALVDRGPRAATEPVLVDSVLKMLALGARVGRVINCTNIVRVPSGDRTEHAKASDIVTLAQPAESLQVDFHARNLAHAPPCSQRNASLGGCIRRARGDLGGSTVPLYARRRRFGEGVSVHSGRSKESTASLSLSTYSAPGGLRQDAGRAAQSPAKITRTYGNGRDEMRGLLSTVATGVMPEGVWR